MGAEFFFLAADLRDGEPDTVRCLRDIWEHRVDCVCSIDEPGDDLETTVQGVRMQLRKDIATVVDAFERGSCESGLLTTRDGQVHLIAGGMSWGDPPTGLFRVLDRLRRYSIFNITCGQEIVLAWRLGCLRKLSTSTEELYNVTNGNI